MAGTIESTCASLAGHRSFGAEDNLLARDHAQQITTNDEALWRYQRQWALVMAPGFLSHLVQEGDFPLGKQAWQDTEVIMPDGAPTPWRNVITNEVLSAGQALPVGDILLSFPVAFLMGEGKAE